MTGYEDANVGVWSMATGQQIHNMLGHNGGVTGIQIQFNLAASSSYDTTVSMKTLRRYQIFVLTFSHFIQGVPKKTQFLGILAITPLWKGLELKVGGVSKTSGNSLCDRHKNFPI